MKKYQVSIPMLLLFAALFSCQNDINDIEDLSIEKSLIESDSSTAPTLNRFPEEGEYDYQIFVALLGGNGTPDGAQANRYYSFGVLRTNECNIIDFKVLNQNSTGFHQVVGDNLVLWWKPSYVGTVQTIKATCECGDNDVMVEDTKTVIIHN